MAAPLLLRYAAAVVLGIGAAVWAWARASEIRPTLDIETHRSVRTENFELWDVVVTARGGETIGEVRVEPQSPQLHLVGPGTYQGLKSGWKKTFRLEFSDATESSNARVLVWQKDPDAPVYERFVGGRR